MKEQQNPNVSLSFLQRLYYGMGSVGYSACAYWVSAFVQIYYTDTIGVSVGTVAVLIFAVRIFDAVNDPLIGSLADRTHSLWGRYRPWLLFAGVGVPLSIIALFSARSSWSDPGKVAWMSFWYVVVTVMSTSYDMPYNALHGAMSSKPSERVKIASIRLACSSVGTQITGMLGVFLVVWFSQAGGARTEGGYQAAVALICLLAIPLSVWPAFRTRERVLPPASQKKIPVKMQLQTLWKNPPVMIVTFAMMAFGFIGYGRGSMMIYYCTYVLGNAKAMSVYSITHLLGTLVGNLLVMPLIYRLIRDKGRCAALGHLCCGVLCILTFAVAPGSLLFWALTFLTAVSIGTFNSIQYSMLGDTVDYGEYKVGLRCDGFLASFTSFALKAGGAVSPAIGLAMLQAAGYLPNAAQGAQSLAAMKLSISVIPGICALVTAALLYFGYHLTEQEHSRIQDVLEQRRSVS